jgi:cytosol alanyl aminopeptidase
MKRVLALALLVLSPLVHAATFRLGNDVVPASQDVTLTVDPRSDVYRGSVMVAVDVKRPTRSFRFHAQDLSITSLRLSEGRRPIDAVYTAGEGSTVLVTAGERLQAGRYSLEVDFTNRFNRQAVGLYKMSTRDGEPYLFTQFEPAS